MFSQLSFDEFDLFIGLEHASDHFVSNKSNMMWVYFCHIPKMNKITNI